MVTAAD